MKNSMANTHLHPPCPVYPRWELHQDVAMLALRKVLGGDALRSSMHQLPSELRSVLLIPFRSLNKDT